MKRWIPSLLAASTSMSGSLRSEEPPRLPAALEAGVVLRFEVERLIERSVLDGEVLDVRGGRKVEKGTGKPASIRSFPVESRIEYRVEVLEASADEALIAVSSPRGRAMATATASTAGIHPPATSPASTRRSGGTRV